MRQLIELAVQPSRIQLHERSRLIPATGPQVCQAIADWLTEIQELPRKGEFPRLGEEYDSAREDYHRWIAQIPPPDS
jgi:hypothetical protein